MQLPPNFGVPQISISSHVPNDNDGWKKFSVSVLSDRLDLVSAIFMSDTIKVRVRDLETEFGVDDVHLLVRAHIRADTSTGPQLSLFGEVSDKNPCFAGLNYHLVVKPDMRGVGGLYVEM